MAGSAPKGTRRALFGNRDDALPALLTSNGDLMTLPHRDRMDGAYAARLRRIA